DGDRVDDHVTGVVNLVVDLPRHGKCLADAQIAGVLQGDVCQRRAARPLRGRNARRVVKAFRLYDIPFLEPAVGAGGPVRVAEPRVEIDVGAGTEARERAVRDIDGVVAVAASRAPVGQQHRGAQTVEQLRRTR